MKKSTLCLFVMTFATLPISVIAADSGGDKGSPPRDSSSANILKDIRAERTRYEARRQVLIKKLADAKTPTEKAAAVDELKAELAKHKASFAQNEEALKRNHAKPKNPAGH